MEPKLEKVAGHPYSRVLSGPHKGQYLNQTDNRRHGEFFRLVEKAGRMQHVYGAGKGREVLTMPAAQPAATPTTSTPAAPGVATDVSGGAAAAAKAAAQTTAAASSSSAAQTAARLLAATGGLTAPDES